VSSATAAKLTRETVELPSGRNQAVFRGGEGPALVWLHAADGIGSDDHPLLSKLMERHSVVAPLAPGFEDLAELDEVNDIHELAMHYEDLLETLGLEQATVVGHSFGGMIGAELAAHYPARVAELVLIAPVGLWNEDYPVIDFFAVPVPELPDVLFADPAFKPPPPAAESEEEIDVEALVTLVQGLTSVAKFMWPIPDRGLARRLYRIRARTLVVFGAEDALAPARYADDFVAGIADARKVIVPGAGHMVPIERTDEVLAAIEEFLAPAAA
jgi:pimeloyl-ACP methyl ester carboxylesterase